MKPLADSSEDPQKVTEAKDLSEATLMKFYALSDKGQERKVNQDSCGYFTADTGLSFFIVADGMGGHNAGEVASAIAVDTFINQAKSITDIEKFEQAPDFIKGVYRRANDIILYKAAADSSRTGMGTTAVSAVVSKDRIVIGNLGDSRAYIISDGKINQVTEDHSYVEQLLKAGSIKEEEAKIHPRRNEITKALGIEFYFEPDIFELEYKEGDVLLLCSDGLDKMIDDEMILDIASQESEPTNICQRLVDSANAAGGLDNISVIAVVFER